MSYKTVVNLVVKLNFQFYYLFQVSDIIDLIEDNVSLRADVSE